MTALIETPGDTPTYCVLGNPIAHSRSPWIHARFAELTGQALVYTKELVALDGFTAHVNALRAAGVRGCNVTVPFKLEAAALADHVSPRAALAGACNVLHFVEGRILADNSDGVGLVRDITVNAGVALHGRDVLLIGSGGAAAGVLGPLLESQPRRVVVVNRTQAKAQALVHSHAALALLQKVELSFHNLQGIESDFDVVINATASSLTGSNIPIPASCLRPGSLAVDLMYGPAAQVFLDWARAHGAQSRDGLGMLVEQAAVAFALWRGVNPPSAQVLAELRAVLART
jgi:shikimate dehydrogenase